MEERTRTIELVKGEIAEKRRLLYSSKKRNSLFLNDYYQREIKYLKRVLKKLQDKKYNR